MKVAALPFNSPQGAQAPLGRQLVNFICENLRIQTGQEVGMVSLMIEVEEDGVKKTGLVNLGDGLAEDEILNQLFSQPELTTLMDGLLTGSPEEGMELHVRIHQRGEGGFDSRDIYYSKAELSGAGIFSALSELMTTLAHQGGLDLPEGSKVEFGSEDPMAFLQFLRGYDSVIYVQQTEGMVPSEFDPKPAIDSLMASIKADPDYLGPYESLVHFCRICNMYGLGDREMIKQTLGELAELEESDFRAKFVLGEVYQAEGDLTKAEACFADAVKIEPNDPSLYTRLGIVHRLMGMFSNAEKNFRKAIELEGPDKPTLEFLSQVLAETNRAHEVPAMWKEMVVQNPQNPNARVRLAVSHLQAGNQEEGIRTLETGLEELEDNTMIKRFYAPILVQENELDRAMDFYEDCLDANPTDVRLLLEYATALQKAGRDFEIAKVLRDVLSSNPDRNTEAQTKAWLLEVEQPKRTGVVEEARLKMQGEDFEGGVRLLKPLRNWLADYWKLWALLAAAYNRLEEPKEAEDCARRLIDLYPACEPAYGELVGALAAQDRHEEAYHVMRMAAQQMPQSLPTALNLALAAKHSGREEEAQHIAKAIRASAPNNPEIDKILDQIEGPGNRLDSPLNPDEYRKRD